MPFLTFTNVDLHRKISTGLGFSLIILIASSIISYISLRKLIEQSFLVNHTNEVILQLENIISSMKDAETAQRGYLLTGNKVFLEPFNGSQQRILKEYQTVRLLTKNSHVQQQRLDTLKTLIDKRYERLNTVINSFHTQKIAEADLIEGKLLMDHCRSIISRMKAEEIKLLQIHEKEVARFATNTPIIIISSSLFAIIISVVSFIFISRDIKNKMKSEIELKNLNKKLVDSNEELIANRNEIDKRNYLLSGITTLHNLTREEKDTHQLADKIIRHLCESMKAQAGALYIMQDDGRYHLASGYAIDTHKNVSSAISPGEGLVGQAALEKKSYLLNDIPAQSLKINSGLVSIHPLEMLIVPFYYNEHTVAVVELVNKDKFLEIDLDYIKTIGDNISIAISRLDLENKTMQLLHETQSQAEELEAQQEELKQMNEELKEQTEELKASEEELKVSQEELEEKNEEMEEKAIQLQEQFDLIKTKNRELEEARAAILQKIKDVEKVSKYKSEFLANMSHELRTPLNSILILAKLLSDNATNNLSAKQVEFAHVIHNSGNDLLKLINDILDLSKIEAGQVRLDVQAVPVNKIRLESSFAQIADKKKISFESKFAPDLPATIQTDEFRLEQILKNLLSNAFKFTPEGGRVQLEVYLAATGLPFSNPNLTKAKQVIAFSVKDTGIGISKDKQAIIFEAFQQADTSTTRKYGGTGLGLSISRDLAILLGGEIKLESKENQGSTFTLYLPEKFEHTADTATPVDLQNYLEELSPIVPETKTQEKTSDVKITPISILEQSGADSAGKEKTIVIIEDDKAFSKILSDFALTKNFKPYTAYKGKDGIDLVKQHKPLAVLLDINLPDISGWEVLDKIRADKSLQDIPVHIMSAYDKEIFSKGIQAQNYLPKPVTLESLDKAFDDIKNKNQKHLQRILIIEDDIAETLAVKELLLAHELSAVSAATGQEAFELLERENFDCIILDMHLPDMGGYEVLEKLKNNNRFKTIPIVIYSGKDFNAEEEYALKKYANTVVIKSEYSYKRLMEEVQLFLHKVHEKLPFEPVSKKPQSLNGALKGKKILLVDDDMRNIYSLYTVLEDKSMIITVANDGKQALQKLEENPGIDLVLMDIMMPEMDGLECTRRIRNNAQFKNLPIIALTAKAMQDDREKCLEAGASDYISKPVDVDKLLSLMTVWLYKK